MDKQSILEILAFLGLIGFGFISVIVLSQIF